MKPYLISFFRDIAYAAPRSALSTAFGSRAMTRAGRHEPHSPVFGGPGPNPAQSAGWIRSAARTPPARA